jgi:uncharacterized protein (UPF0548 family)
MSRVPAAQQLTYAPVGATRPADARWSERPAGFRRYEHTVRIGHGPAAWAAASAAVLAWGVKTRSGFRVVPDSQVEAGADHLLVASVGPVRVREPVRVVAVVDVPDRCGFAYGTLTGHPVSGEEAFVVHRTADGAVQLTLRSLTAPARGAWRPVFPLLLVAQRVYRRRYLRALRPSAG